VKLSLRTPWRRKGEWRYNFYPFLTWARDWSVHTPVVSSLAKRTPLAIKYEAGWASELVWTFRRRENLIPLPGIEPWFFCCTALCLDSEPTEISLSFGMFKEGYNWYPSFAGNASHLAKATVLNLRISHKLHTLSSVIIIIIIIIIIYCSWVFSRCQ
jgi:hypothetical protein